MASAFTKLFLPSHRKRSANASSSRHQEPSRSRFATSSTFDLRHSIPEESASATDSTFPSLPSTSKLTVQHLNHHVSEPISDATLRRRSLAIDSTRSFSSHTLRPPLPRSFSAHDVTAPLQSHTHDSHDSLYPPSQPSPPPVDDDDDIDSNPLYLHLSEDTQLSPDWNLASLALIPLARTLTTHNALRQSDLDDPHFVALHAFAPSKLYKHQFVSVRSLTQSSAIQHAVPTPQNQYDWSNVTLTATIESDQKSVSITETVHAASATPNSAGLIPTSATIKRKLNIVSETTIYRTLPAPTPTPTPTPNTTLPTSSSGFQVTSRSPTHKDTPTPSPKVRVISVDLPIVHRRIEGAGASHSQSISMDGAPHSPDSSTHEIDPPVSDLILDHIPSHRLFGADLAILASPPATSQRLAHALSETFQVLFSAAHQFTATFVYVKGFDSYNAHRIRRGIWFKAWKAFEERLGSEHISRLSVEAFHRIKSLLENVVMGLVHTKMYGPIQDQLLDADLVVEDVLAAYNASSVSLADFGVQHVALRQRPSNLAHAIATLRLGLRDDGGTDIDQALASCDSAQLTAVVQQAASEVPPITESIAPRCLQTDLGLVPPDNYNSEQPATLGELHRRTPLQILQTLRGTIDQIGWAAERLHYSSSRASYVQERPPPLSPDDLLPILSYVFVRAQPSRLCSMLYYARLFQLTDTATSPELQWALVTCDAVVAYLRTDPLRLCHRTSSSSVVVETTRTGSHSQTGSGGTNDTLAVRSMSSRSHLGSAAASSLQVATLIARSPSAHDSSSVMDATPPQSPRSPFLPVDASSDHLSTSGSLSYFLRQGDSSNEHSGYAASEASPRLQAEGFKLPGLPASVSSRRNSRILQQRPTSIFSLSEDGDAASVVQDTSLDTLDRRLSATATQSPSHRLSMRNRTLSASSSSTTHNDVQIRPQIVRTIKRSQAANLYTSNRLERTSSNGSTASSSHVHVRVVGSPSIRAVDTASGRESPSINASPPKSDRRRSFDSWSAFSLFSSNAVPSGASASSERIAGNTACINDASTTGTLDDRTVRLRNKADHPADVSAASAGPAGTATSSGWLSWGAEAINRSRRNSESTSNSRANSAIDNRVVPRSKTVNAESDDVNCQPEGVEALRSPTELSLGQRTGSVRSSSSLASISDVCSVQWPASESVATASISSLPGTMRSKRRYRGRFLSTSSATLAGSAAPLPPQVDRSSADLARPRPTQRQSFGSLTALRATMNLDTATSAETTNFSSPTSGDREAREEVPEMSPSGGSTTSQHVETSHSDVAVPGSLLPLFIQLHLPSPVAEARDPLGEANTCAATGSDGLGLTQMDDRGSIERAGDAKESC